MTRRRSQKEININVEWTINYDPATPIQKAKWSKFWAGVLAETRENTDGSKVTVETQPSPNEADNMLVHSKTTFRCSRCGQTWPEKSIAEGIKDPDWWKCPNGCYKKKK